MLSSQQKDATTPTWETFFSEQARACRDPALQQFYATDMPDPETPIRDVEMMALDFETTGMDHHRHAIVSIGMVPFTLRTIRPNAGHYWVVRPQRPLDEASIIFHRITHAEVADAPDLNEVLDEVLDALAGRLAVVHFRHIERPFLDTAVVSRRGERCLFPVIDTMALEARQQRHGWLSRLKAFFGGTPVSIRLADSRTRYGLPAYSSHHAKLDALATAELLQAQIATHYSPETPVGDLWS